jgi:hypothetical protein
MAKNKKTNKVQQLLSPENYIRQRARSLPIYECIINDDWKTSGTAHMVIVRKHINGSLTLAIYMVDLLCLGVRDTYYRFNISTDDYHDLLDIMSESMNMQKVDYVLVHNIVLAAAEFAKDLGFKPHKEFTATTQYMLDEDTEEIELIEIECGRNDKPLFIKTDVFTESESQRITNQLEKAVGKGNFDVIYGSEEEMDFEDTASSELDAIDFKYAQMTPKERYALFLEITKDGLDNIPDEMYQPLIILTDNIYLRDVCDDDTVEALVKKWQAELDTDIDKDTFTAESLGLKAHRQITRQESEELDKIYSLVADMGGKVLEKIEKLKDKWGEMPFVYYMETQELEKDDFDKYLAKLDQYSALYPNYPFFKIEKKKASLLVEKENPELIAFEEIFPNRTSITQAEEFEFQMTKLQSIVQRNNTNELEAMAIVCENLQLTGSYHESLHLFLSLARIGQLMKHFGDNSDKKRNHKSPTTYQFKIQLKNISKPTVWRRMLVASDMTFNDFHIAIQIAFGWETAHLYCFSPSGYGSSPKIESSELEPLDGSSMDALETELREIFDHEKQKFTYLYDFGDNWIHEITLEKILPDSHIEVPQILKGKGTCPPEDCGGQWGYAELRETLANKKHPAHKETREWLGLKRGQEWDAEDFPLDERQQILAQCFAPNKR